MSSPKVIFLHLSDIHFSRAAPQGGTPIVNYDIRNQLIHDAAVMVKTIGAPHQILISGDVAFSGHADEYDQANQWLKELCKALSVERDRIRVICGNHDINRGAINASQTVRDIQRNLRSLEISDLNDYVDGVVRDQYGGGAPFAPLSNYNSFAEAYQGHFNSSRPFWNHTVVMSDKSRLVIRGLNSALASNAEDHEEHKKLVLGSGYAVLVREEGVEHLSMCHHPPGWMRDQRDVERYLNSRARLQLFGHLHEPRIEELGDKTFRCLRLYAGAVNPERPNETGKPCYNWFTVSIVSNDRDRKMDVEVFPRIWVPCDTRFQADYSLTHGHESATFHLELPPFELKPETARYALVAAAGAEPVPTLSDPLNVVTSSDKQVQRIVALRRFAFNFLGMPFNVQVSVATTLDLLRPEDRSVSSTELFRRLFERAEQQKITARFWDLVRERQNDRGSEPNPFQ